VEKESEIMRECERERVKKDRERERRGRKD